MSWLITAPGRTTSRMGTMMLCLEALLVVFATLVAFRLSDLSAAAVWVGGGAISVACLLACGVLRRPGGMAVGGVLQFAILLTGLVVPAMWVMGGIFVLLWVWLAWVGQKIDTDRQAYEGAAQSR